MKVQVQNIHSKSWTDMVPDYTDVKGRLTEEGYTMNMVADIIKGYESIRADAGKLSEEGYFKDPAFYEETERRKSIKALGNPELAYYKGGAEANLWAQYIKDALRNLLSHVEHRTEDTVDVEIKFPLFKLHSPNVNGSEVIYQESQTEETKGSYNITVFGTGFGNTKEFSFASSSTFTSKDGSYKLIYAIGILRSELISIYKKGVLAGKGLRTEIVFDKNQELGIGIDAITQAEYLKGIDVKQVNGKNFKLSGDNTGTIQSFKEAWKVTNVYSHMAGIKAFNINATCKAEIKQVKDISLEFNLPSGHDYQLLKINNGYGLVWV